MTAPLSFKPPKELRRKILELAESDFGGITAQALNHIAEKHFNMENQYATLDDACPALCFIDDHYECRWGRMGKTPDMKKIGKTIEAVNEGCSACRKTLDMTEKLATMTEQLERGKVIQLPSCRRGAKLNEDMTELFCPEIGKWRPIKERKKKTDPQPCHARGTPPYKRCQFIEWTQTVIKGKLPDGQNL